MKFLKRSFNDTQIIANEGVVKRPEFFSIGAFAAALFKAKWFSFNAKNNPVWKMQRKFLPPESSFKCFLLA